MLLDLDFDNLVNEAILSPVQPVEETREERDRAREREEEELIPISMVIPTISFSAASEDGDSDDRVQNLESMKNSVSSLTLEQRRKSRASSRNGSRSRGSSQNGGGRERQNGVEQSEAEFLELVLKTGNLDYIKERLEYLERKKGSMRIEIPSGRKENGSLSPGMKERIRDGINDMLQVVERKGRGRSRNGSTDGGEYFKVNSDDEEFPTHPSSAKNQSNELQSPQSLSSHINIHPSESKPRHRTRSLSPPKIPMSPLPLSARRPSGAHSVTSASGTNNLRSPTAPLSPTTLFPDTPMTPDFIVDTDAHHLHYLPAHQLAFRRTPAILLTLLLELVVSLVVNEYDDTLKKYIILTSFMPLISSISGNIGLQSSTATLRSLATGLTRLEWKDAMKTVIKELLAAFFIASLTGGLLGVLVAFWAKDSSVGIVAGMAVFFSGSLAGLMGSGGCCFVKYCGIDPAVTAGPLETAVQDLVGITIYLATATWLLP
ncbi:hypothetical protein BKA69DRAFT_1115592 [Paraphysoderma sedebokerense]|nr:hypothetical protein BKA69DRAFT_1115592 [Paraphysoderma sedebokerense]